MRDHYLRAESLIPLPRGEVFAFFAAAENLERITPDELRFSILSPLPLVMAAGLRIDYQLRLFGIPFRWRTVISRWEEGTCFVDEQISGPYALWVHTHTFADAPGGTLVNDEVRYRLPLYPFGELALPLVRRQLRRIFNHRSAAMAKTLGVGATTATVNC
jgi:ligand-binding SRPBCC domain-containing protein